ncbi:MAG: hypothetical protein BIFFINMI_01848 [Phycisphaerae bacterium]|nr:hypothetical protein [Phycisphaerae bacterium]
MILQALNTYYERLAADPDSDIAPFGFSRQKISFCVVLEPDGRLHGFEQVVSEVVNGRPIPKSEIVPGQNKPPGAGINPCFLWDNATYMLGRVPEGREPAWAQNRFEAFRDRHLAAEAEIDDEAFSAACRFLEQWSQPQLDEHPELADVVQSFGLFRIRGEKFVHDRPAVQAWWLRQIDAGADDVISGMCLVSGKTEPLARLHEPKIKNVQDAQTSGASLVAFNLDAFESHGKAQSYNAPVSENAAFQYATALNRLLGDRRRRIQIGDATTVFWTDKPSRAEQIVPSLFAGGHAQADDPEDGDRLESIRAFLDRLRQGKPDAACEALGDPGTTYYILGLSPNAARVSVRFWLTGSLGELARRLALHVEAIEIVGLDEHPPILRDLLRETAPAKSGWPDEEKIPKPLETGLAHAVLKGLPYPLAFYSSILRRIAAEQFVDHEKRKDWRRAMSVRAAAIKAVLIRNFRKEITVALDPDRTEPAYRLGRWFALLEMIQRDALGRDLNKTIKDRFYTAASATPAVVFPRLIQLSQHHLAKIENPRWRITREKQVQEVADGLNSFPRRLTLENQGLFHLGYYHQVQALYTKKDAQDSADADSTPQPESE